MENRGLRSDTPIAAGGGQFKENGSTGAAGSSISDSVARSRDAVAGAANEAMSSAGSI